MILYFLRDFKQQCAGNTQKQALPIQVGCLSAFMMIIFMADFNLPTCPIEHKYREEMLTRGSVSNCSEESADHYLCYGEKENC